MVSRKRRFKALGQRGIVRVAPLPSKQRYAGQGYIAGHSRGSLGYGLSAKGKWKGSNVNFNRVVINSSRGARGVSSIMPTADRQRSENELVVLRMELQYAITALSDTARALSAGVAMLERLGCSDIVKEFLPLCDEGALQQSRWQLRKSYGSDKDIERHCERGTMEGESRG
mgnify:FL=1